MDTVSLGEIFEAGQNNLSVFVLTVEPDGGPRRQNAIRELAKVGLRGAFVEGFKKTDPTIREEYSATINLIARKRSLTDGEIAVYCGHRAIWREFLKGDSEAALVLEDDFQVVDAQAFSRAIDDCLAHPGAWGMVKLFDFEPREIKRRVVVGGTELVKYREVPTGAVAYLIDRVTAQRFLSRRKFFRPVDEDFSWEWGVDFWSLYPSPVADGGQMLGGSLLESDRGHRDGRNVVRSLWAAAIKTYKQCRQRLA